jgi:hypothetical protein
LCRPQGEADHDLADRFRDRINDHAIHRLDALLPWNWAAEMERGKVAA